MMNPDSFKRLLSVAILGFLPGQLDAKAQDNQFGQNVRTFCSQYDLGQYHFWECDSTITYAEPANARIFYCKGVHLVVTRAGKVHDISAKAQCALLFDTHPDSRGFTLLDMALSLWLDRAIGGSAPTISNCPNSLSRNIL